MRDKFPLLLSSYLMVYACIQLVFQITQVFDIANELDAGDMEEIDLKRRHSVMITTSQAIKAEEDAKAENGMSIPVALPATSMGGQLPKRGAYSIAGQDSLINNEEIVLLSGLDST